MTKADILKLLAKVPMGTEILFVEAGVRGDTYDREYELKRAFTVVGADGLCLLLTSGGTPTEYEDVEGL